MVAVRKFAPLASYKLRLCIKDSKTDGPKRLFLSTNIRVMIEKYVKNAFVKHSSATRANLKICNLRQLLIFQRKYSITF